MNALLKHAELGFPGETFWKWHKAPFYKEIGTALLKLADNDSPGNTLEVSSSTDSDDA